MKLTATTIIFYFFSVALHAQLQKTSHFHRKTGWLCNENIMLDSTGLFFQEWGCESDVRVTFGKYNLTKAGRLRLKFLPLDSIAPIAYIKQTDVAKDSVVKVSLLDREGKAIYSSFQLTLVDTAGKLERKWLDDHGLLLINRLRYKEAILDQLLSIYNEVVSIPINDRSVEIRFNLPGSFLEASQTSRGTRQQQILFVKSDGLYGNTKKRLYQLAD